jgi:hypothetical protein
MGEWPEFDLGKVDPKTVDMLLETTREALKQQVEGARTIYTRSASVLTQAATLAVASFGAAAVSAGAISPVNGWAATRWAISGLSVTAALWAVAAVLACHSMRSMKFGSISPDPASLTDEKLYYADHVDAKVYLLKSQVEGLQKSREDVKWNRKWLHLSIWALSAAPAAGLIAAGIAALAQTIKWTG